MPGTFGGSVGIGAEDKIRYWKRFTSVFSAYNILLWLFELYTWHGGDPEWFSALHFKELCNRYVPGIVFWFTGSIPYIICHFS